MVGGGAQIVPWLGEIDGNGKLDWQSLYFEVYAPTGRPLSEYFAAADPTSHNGAMAVGYTEDYPAQKGELYAVRTDRSGNVSGCADAHSAPATNVLDPALVEFGPSLAIGVAGLTGSSAPVTTLPTSIHVQHECS
jgi:hypothetical protein